MQQKIIIGLTLTLIIAIFIPVYWAMEPGRQEAALERQHAWSMEKGAKHYLLNCAVCHGSRGEGLIGPALKDGPLNEDALERIMSRGIPGAAMPAWSEEDGGPLTGHQIQHLVDFIRNWDSRLLEEQEREIEETLAPPPTTVAETDEATAAGKALFAAKSCAICHGVGAEGTALAPALLGYSESTIFKLVREGGEGMPSFNIDQISDEELSEIAAFLESP